MRVPRACDTTSSPNGETRSCKGMDNTTGLRVRRREARRPHEGRNRQTGGHGGEIPAHEDHDDHRRADRAERADTAVQQ